MCWNNTPIIFYLHIQWMNECSENFLLRNDAEHLLPDRRSAAPRRVTVTSSRVKLETRILFSVGVAWESVTDRITIASFQLSTDERLFWGKHRFLSGWGENSNPQAQNSSWQVVPKIVICWNLFPKAAQAVNSSFLLFQILFPHFFKLKNCLVYLILNVY